MKRVGIVLLGAALVAASAATAAAQSVAKQNQEILNELRQIRQLLEKLATPSQPNAPPAMDENVKLSSNTGYLLGDPDAPLTMVEFTDLQCPFCRQFHTTTFEQLKKDYIDTGKLRYFARDFPLDQLHPFANLAARASRCAADQGKFWEMRHSILANNAQLNAAAFESFAKDLQLNVETFKTCTDDTKRFQNELQKDAADATAAGVSGTPTFVVGRTTKTGLDGVRVVGAQPFANFDAKLKELLEK